MSDGLTELFRTPLLHGVDDLLLQVVTFKGNAMDVRRAIKIIILPSALVLGVAVAALLLLTIAIYG